ncbi:NAD(P)H-dependent FMN reductase [Mycena sanguinolenta]|uniref:NAD(P)H-dependent FMN reductase n=1 Tax=Mycena sanguinolenta TaxID=230812 RepID=A0A8H6XXC2_9AGAR|nr:NAD(P)H-dependent FMN reductase [Mycena sanguinolenta]
MDHPLPLYTAEPLVPSRIPRPLTFNSYADPATNAWSALISSFDGFIIVTPQHNWGYPASLKLALDALFHEWTGKPVLLVTYGGLGWGEGRRAASPGAGGHAPACVHARRGTVVCQRA